MRYSRILLAFVLIIVMVFGNFSIATTELQKPPIGPVYHNFIALPMPVNYGEITGDSNGSYLHGASVTVTAEPFEGYAFKHWQIPVIWGPPHVFSTDPVLTTTMDHDKYVQAVFEDLYNLYAYPNDVLMGTATGSGDYVKGEKVNLTATPNDNYRFLYWNLDGSWYTNDQNFKFKMPSYDVDFEAVFEAIPSFEVTAVADPPQGGEVTGAGIYMVGDEVNLEAIPARGYEFIEWSWEWNCPSKQTRCPFERDDPTITFNMPECGLDFVAHFAPLPLYNVNLDVYPEGGGTAVTEGPYYATEDVTITATPAMGYRFVKWESSIEPEIIGVHGMPTPGLDYEIWEPVYTFEMPYNHVYFKAIFEPIPIHEVHLFVEPEGTGTAVFEGEDQSGYYGEGEAFTLIATPKVGYEFLYWTWEYCEYEMPNGDYSSVAKTSGPIYDDPELTWEMGEYDLCFTAHFGELEKVTVNYVNAAMVSLAASDVLYGHYDDPYTTTPKSIAGYTLTATPTNATGYFHDDPIVVNYIYRLIPQPEPEPTTEAATAAPTTAAPTTEAITEEEVPLGPVAYVDVDALHNAYYPEAPEVVPAEEIDEEETPLADALPQTGQLPADLFYGIGGLISAAGVFIRRKK